MNLSGLPGRMGDMDRPIDRSGMIGPAMRTVMSRLKREAYRYGKDLDDLRCRI